MLRPDEDGLVRKSCQRDGHKWSDIFDAKLHLGQDVPEGLSFRMCLRTVGARRTRRVCGEIEWVDMKVCRLHSPKAEIIQP